MVLVAVFQCVNTIKSPLVCMYALTRAHTRTHTLHTHTHTHTHTHYTHTHTHTVRPYSLSAKVKNRLKTG